MVLVTPVLRRRVAIHHRRLATVRVDARGRVLLRRPIALRPRARCRRAQPAAARGRADRPLGDGQRLRHAAPPEHDRRPRLDAGPPRAARGLRMRFRVQYLDDGGPLALRRGRGLGLAAASARRAAAPSSRAGRFEFAPPAEPIDVPRRRALPLARARRASSAARAESPRPATAPRAGADPAGYSAATCSIGLTAARRPNSRGSLVITPVTPIASSARIRARVVDRPHVQLPARRAHRAQQRGVTSRQWAITASQRPAARCARAEPRQLAAHVAAAPSRPAAGTAGLRVVAAHPRHRPAEPQPRLQRPQRDEAAHVLRRDQRALDAARARAAPPPRAPRSRAA